MADQPSPGTTSVPSYETEAPRRERAPTITVDTSAVSPPGAGQDVVPRRQSTSTAGDQPILNVDFSGARTPTGSVYGRNGSISDGMDSRPTSPHNVSSPTARNYEQNFLAVPGERSRGNSVTSDDLSPTQTHFSAGPDAPVNSPAAMNGDAKAPDKKAKDVGRPVFVDDDDDGDALKPDPGTEADFEVSDNKFAFTPGHMGKMYNPKSHAAFYALGGLRGIEMGLQTDRHAGLSVDETVLDRRISFDEVKERVHSEVSPTDTSAAAAKDWDASETTAAARTSAGDGAPENGPFADRRRVFNENRLPKKKTKSILQLAWIAYKDKILILLSFAALISLALGIYQSVGGLHAPDEPAVEWVEGVAIVVAIFIVVSVGALNDWQKERQFVKLNKKKEDRVVKVIRSGRSQEMSVYDLLVGDVMHLEPGDLIPVDGVLVDGDGVRCDESSATGESDIIKKTPAEMVYRAIEEHRDVRKLDPFILSGAKVNEGIGTFVVTAVGVNSTHGKTLIALREDMEATPLQIKLNKLAEQIAKLGGAAALLLFVVLFIKFLVQLPRNSDPPAQKGRRFMRILITAITVIVVAVPEGLPLAVTLALAFATTRMLKDNNLVRVLRACETMGNATTICSDKTGTLTQNKMTVVAGTVGLSSRFEDRDLAASAESDEAGAQGAEGSKPVAVNHGGGDDLSSSSSAHGLIAELSPDAKSALLQSIVLNSTAFEGEDDGKPTFVGSKTETALLLFARDHLGLQSLSVERANAQVVQSVPFDSGRKCMATVVRLGDGRHRMYVKGASEIMLAKCSAVVPRPTTSAETAPMTSETAEALNQLITSYASRSLRTIGLLYQDYEKWPPTGTASEENADKADFDRVFRNMTFLAVVGIQDPLRVGVRNAVRRCQKAGVFVRMVTGDNLITARAIAQQCGIYTEGGIIMEGPKFRKLSKRDMDRTIPRLQVLARSSPEDKRILVKRLKELGETVAVTGDGTNDAPALKTADIGFSMGIAGTEVAKEASAIILMDDNFASIVKAMMWGRAVNDAVRKFLQVRADSEGSQPLDSSVYILTVGVLQFQLTVNITAVLLTFISAVSNENQESVLKAVQLLWVNLIMDTFAALALATDPPTDSILERRPDRKSAPLISITMWKMILGQAVFQLVVTLIIYYAGTEIFDYETAEEIDRLPTLVFNTFVWMQIFNMVK